MDLNYTLKYRSFDSALEDVKVDLKNFSLEGKIEPQQLIKIALKCNYDLGLRINMIKDKVIDVELGRARLPDDFRVMNYAMICGDFTDTFVNPQGTWVEDVAIPASQIPLYQDPVEPNPCTDVIINSCTPTLTPNTTTPICLSKCVDNCGNPNGAFQLVQKIHTTTRHYKFMYPVRFRNSKAVCPDSPNLNWMCRDEAYIRDGFIWFYNNQDTSSRNSFCGKLFINYEGALEDSEGNVLIPDHPMINEYYEYSIKLRILENLLMEGDDTDKYYQLVVQKVREARNYALTICNTPNFWEMAKNWETNRKAFYNKYYHMFSSYAPDPRVFRPANHST